MVTLKRIYQNALQVYACCNINKIHFFFDMVTLMEVSFSRQTKLLNICEYNFFTHGHSSNNCTTASLLPYGHSKESLRPLGEQTNAPNVFAILLHYRQRHLAACT